MKKYYQVFLALLLIILVFGCKSVQTNEIVKSVPPPLEEEFVKLKPAKLNRGNTIGLIAPGSYITQSQLDESIKNFEDLGYKVKYSKNILSKYGYLAGFDSERVEDIHSMFADKEVNAIVAVRGGYGCARLLPILNYELIKANPKILIGYSDITSLLYGIYEKAGLVCFHGPVGTSTFNEYSVNHFNNILAEPKPNYEMKNLPEDEDQLFVINEGVAEGELVGGNLSIVVSMIGTEYDIDSKDKIIFLEEIGEEPYRIDRMLTQMRQSGKFDGCKGLALGVFERCEARERDPEFPRSLTLKQVLQDRLGDLGIPVIYGLSFGHIKNKFTLPFGIKAKLDTYNKRLTLLEEAVK
jgi:muramoyltetrapeptide carboxypeptidase